MTDGGLSRYGTGIGASDAGSIPRGGHPSGRRIPLGKVEVMDINGGVDLIDRFVRSRVHLHLVPLGDLAGSASIVRYLASHSQKIGHKLKTCTVKEVLRTNPNTDLFFADDSCLSGTQALNTIKELLGTRRLKPHHTRHADKLPLPLRKELLKRNCKFCFAVATDYGIRRLKKELKALGFKKVSVQASHIEQLDQKLFSAHFASLWRNRNEMVDTQEFLRNVGYQILESRAHEKKWDEARRKESALGFSDFQRLIVFEHNTPKTTLTALWESGKVDGKKWIPLFPTTG
jgi:hypothetical protein